MTRRTLTSVVVTVLLGVLVGAAFLLPVPYVIFSPGPTVDVLAVSGGKPTIDVSGAKTYPTKGDLRLTTVSMTSATHQLSLVDALAAWFDGTRAVYPRDVIYPPDQSVADVQRESSVQMVSSQDSAIAVALEELGYKLPLLTEVLGRHRRVARRWQAAAARRDRVGQRGADPPGQPGLVRDPEDRGGGARDLRRTS